ncbi:hypothetical protein COV19_00255 [Candidatus Woesearchaeota archaeon CG10_big_fil_rev_8_21_14_0_10_44_13]|nr:MAG: hypothetical protein COV19_00255 [Candidatus Woesearchaeota archaeon CG10_big_fil_rev_8_21_14_0_10_44_13]
MKNRNVGILLLVVALFILFLIVSYNKAMEDIVNATCTHGPECSMYKTIGVQKTISYSLIGMLIAASLYVIIFLKDRTMPGQSAPKPSKKVLEGLDNTEKKILDLVSRSEGSMYQSDIMKETGFSKVKVTRVLDRLEAKGLTERKRRGMTNIVVLR